MCWYLWEKTRYIPTMKHTQAAAVRWKENNVEEGKLRSNLIDLCLPRFFINGLHGCSKIVCYTPSTSLFIVSVVGSVMRNRPLTQVFRYLRHINFHPPFELYDA